MAKLLLILLVVSQDIAVQKDIANSTINANDESIHPQIIIDMTTKALKGNVSPKNAIELIKMQSIALDRSGRYKEAIDGYKKVLKSTPDDLDINYALSFCYLKANKPDEARPFFNKCLEQNPSNLMAHVGLAQTAMRSEQYELAARELEMARRIDSENSSVVLTSAHLGLSNKGTQRDLSIRLISDAISAWVDNHPWQPFVLADFYKDRGKLYYFEGNYTKAIADFRVADSLGFDEHLKLVSQAFTIFSHFRLGNLGSVKILLEDLLAKFRKLPSDHVTYDFLRQFHYMELALSRNDAELTKQIEQLLRADKPSTRDFHIAFNITYILANSMLHMIYVWNMKSDSKYLAPQSACSVLFCYHQVLMPKIAILY